MGRIHFPEDDAETIRLRLGQGDRLVACLCAEWCDACGAWFEAFKEAACAYQSDCFVWIDIDDHPDLVAEVDLETLPVLVVQDAEEKGHVGPVVPRGEVLDLLLQATLQPLKMDPGVWQFLQE